MTRLHSQKKEKTEQIGESKGRRRRDLMPSFLISRRALDRLHKRIRHFRQSKRIRLFSTDYFRGGIPLLTTLLRFTDALIAHLSPSSSVYISLSLTLASNAPPTRIPPLDIGYQRQFYRPNYKSSNKSGTRVVIIRGDTWKIGRDSFQR